MYVTLRQRPFLWLGGRGTLMMVSQPATSGRRISKRHQILTGIIRMLAGCQQYQHMVNHQGVWQDVLFSAEGSLENRSLPTVERSSVAVSAVEVCHRRFS